MDFSKFFSWHYYFTIKVGPLSNNTRETLIIILSVFLLLAFASRLFVYLKKDQPHLVKLFKKSYIFWLANAIIGFVWLFFRAQTVPMFGARFWILIVGLVDLVWLFYIIKYATKKMSKEKEDRQEKDQFKKYLPK